MTSLTARLEPPGACTLDELPDAGTSFFLGRLWLDTWLDTARPVVRCLAVRDAAGRTRAACLLVRSGERRLKGLVCARRVNLQATGDPNWDSIFIEHNGLLGVPEGDLDALDAALDAMRADGSWDEWHLPALPEPVAAHLRRRWPRSRITWEAPTYRVDLNALRRSGQDHAETLSRNSRQQLKRSVRLYEERGPLKLDRAGTVEEALAYLAELKTLHQATWQGRGKGDGAFASPFFETFHKRLIARGTQSGEVELRRLSAGDHTLGYLYNLIRHGHVHAYQSGFAFEPDNRLKPGLVAHALAIQHHLGEGAHIYDLLAGDQRYKSSLAAPGPRLQSLLLWRPRPMLLLEDGLRRLATRLRQAGPEGRSATGDEAVE